MHESLSPQNKPIEQVVKQGRQVLRSHPSQNVEAGFELRSDLVQRQSFFDPTLYVA